MTSTDILDLALRDLEAWCREHGMPAYRGRQLASWLYRRDAREFGAMRNLPLAMRAALHEEFRIGSLELVRTSDASDGTSKLLFQLSDGATIESVLIPDGARLTLCLSTQVGCAMGCTFCATATLGFRRHLRRGEVVAQVVEARRRLRQRAVSGGESPLASGEEPARITNLVFMGMGEPLHNYEGTVGAIETLTADWGLDCSHRRITVSTVGLIPEMQRLLADTQVNLAVSLTAVAPDLRRELMPIGKRYAVAELLSACRALPLPRRKRITFEYVMLGGVNDDLGHARALSRALAGIRCKVNLIPFNAFPGSRYVPSQAVDVARFQDVLRRQGIHATIRESRGRDIAAACGQLVAQEERAPRPLGQGRGPVTQPAERG